MPERLERIGRLRGMDDRWTTEPDTPELLQNVYIDEQGTVRTCGGYAQISSTAFSQVGHVHSLAWFTQHQGGRQFLVWEHRASGALNLVYMNFSTDTVVNIQTGRTLVQGPHAGTTYLEHANWLYVFNGYDKPVRWNRKELVEVGFSVRPPPPVAVTAGIDQADAVYPTSWDKSGFQRGVGPVGSSTTTATSAERWRYGWAITWVNDLGHESPRSAIAWLTDTSPVAVADAIGTPIPRGKYSVLLEMAEAPTNVRGVRIWRTVNMHGVRATGSAVAPLYLVDELPGAGFMHYVEDHADGELGRSYNEDGSGIFPSRVQFAHIFKGTMFCASNADASRLRFSAPLLIEQMPEVNYLAIGDATSGPFMGFKSTKNALIVFKRRGIYLVKGDPVNGFYAETLDEDVGCAAPRSIVEIPNVGTMFVSDDGPYILEGALENTGTPTKATPIMGPISKVWRTEVNKKALASTRASRNMRDREVWLHVPTGGDDRPKLGLIFHMSTGGWSVRRDYPFSCFAETRDHRGYLLAGTWDTSSAKRGVVVYTRGVDAAGTAVSSKIESAWLSPGRSMIPTEVHLKTLNTGTDFDFQWHADRDVLVWLGPSSTQRELKDSENKRATWGTAQWDTDSWQPLVPISMTLHPVPAGAFEFQWRVTGNKLAVTGYDFGFTVNDEREKRGIE